ncbi:MAG: exo-alpha-sialidase, partial [Lentisphaerae bacterium]|nr:exo-alpha-sialidase [Lentisphaerota bacterium]
ADGKDSGDVFVTLTADGRTAETHRVMGDPDEKLQFTEETLVEQTDDGAIWVLTRVEGGDDQMWQGVSRDGGVTWTSRPSGIVGHPPSGFVKLQDGRALLTYGYRHAPFGIRAVLSNDEGLTWDTEHTIVLRNDGGGYDLGYPRSTQLQNGNIFTIYYFTGDNRITHIAGTVWQVPK